MFKLLNHSEQQPAYFIPAKKGLRKVTLQHLLFRIATFCVLILVLPGILTACAGPTTPTAAPTNVAKVTALGSAPVTQSQSQPPTSNQTASQASQKQLEQKLADLPMSFETNNGQSADYVKFLARGQGYTLALNNDATARLSLQRPAVASIDPTDDASLQSPDIKTVQVKLVGANAQPVVSGQGLQDAKTNYFLGNDQSKWLHDISNYSRVQYQAVWPGIDLTYYGQHQQLEYDFIAAPRADTNLIQVHFDGAASIELAKDSGELILQLADGGEIRQAAPHLYQQTSDGQRRNISGGYVDKGANNYGFWIGPEYNPALPLTIDPTVGYSTYLGGNKADFGKGIAVDSAGNAYLLSQTGGNFPAPAALAGNGGPGGTQDAVVTKFNPAGNVIIYSTIFGGSLPDPPTGIAIDSSGDAFVTGKTISTNFPTVNAYQQTKAASVDVYVTELNSTGSSLLYSTYIGGSGSDQSGGIAVDSAGKAYISATGPNATFPHLTTIGPGGGTNDAYIAKFDTTKTGAGSLIYSTRIGGTGSDTATSIAVDNIGNAYITGTTGSNDFPTQGAYQGALGGTTNAYVFELNAAGTAKVYGTYLGGTGNQTGNSIALDSGANPKIYVGGITDSAIPNTTTTIGAGGGGDAFVAKINPAVSGTAGRIYLDVLGGANSDVIQSIAVDGNGQVYFAGNSAGGFPTIGNFAYAGGPQDALVGELTADGSSLIYAVYLGSSGNDQANGIALDGSNSGFAYVVGQTDGTDFLTSSPYQAAAGGGAAGNNDAFVSKVTAPTSVADPSSTYQYTGVNMAFLNPLKLTLTDIFGKPKPGVSVTLTAPPLSGSSGTFVCPCSGSVAGQIYTDTTNASGQFTTPPHFMANNIPSNYVYYNIVATATGFPTTNFVMYNTSSPSGIDTLSVNHNNLNFNGNLNQQNLTLTGGVTTTNWLASVTYDGGVSGWLALSANSGTLLAGNSTAIGVNANAAGLANGRYTASITFQDAQNSGNSVKVNVELTVGNGVGSTYSYYLPFVANNANGFTSQVTLQNTGSGSATVQTQYYNAEGSNISSPNAACSNLSPNAACVAASSLASGTHGTGVIVSNQPLSVLVQESTPFGSSAYGVSAGASASLVTPLAINNNGGFNTQLTVANVGTNPTTAAVTFFDQNGSIIAGATQSLNLAAHSSQTLDQAAAGSNLPNGFYGWAQIRGANGAQLVAQVLETRADIKFTALANAQPFSSGSSTNSSFKLFAPAIFRGAFNGFVTGANIINPNSNQVSVSVTYYDNQGKAYATSPFSLPAYALAPIFQGANSGSGIPTGGLPANFYGSAVVTSEGGSLAMVVNESGNTTKNGAAQSGTYAAVSSIASQKVSLPIVANGGSDGVVSGATVLNTSDTTVSGSIVYYNKDGSQVTTSQNFQIAPHASYPIYQGAINLPQGFVGQAVITTTDTNSSSNPLLVTTNVQNDNLFFTYSEPV